MYTYGLVTPTTGAKTRYRNGGAMGAHVQGAIVEGNQSISPNIQWLNPRHTATMLRKPGLYDLLSNRITDPEL